MVTENRNTNNNSINNNERPQSKYRKLKFITMTTNDSSGHNDRNGNDNTAAISKHKNLKPKPLNSIQYKPYGNPTKGKHTHTSQGGCRQDPNPPVTLCLSALRSIVWCDMTSWSFIETKAKQNS